jgi:hypothetical protein
MVAVTRTSGAIVLPRVVMTPFPSNWFLSISSEASLLPLGRAHHAPEPTARHDVPVPLLVNLFSSKSRNSGYEVRVPLSRLSRRGQLLAQLRSAYPPLLGPFFGVKGRAYEMLETAQMIQTGQSRSIAMHLQLNAQYPVSVRCISASAVHLH